MKLLACVALFITLPTLAQTSAQTAPPTSAVDAIFAAWNNTTPGCAAGVVQQGKTVLLKAWGMAELEHDVANTPDTIFEAGSVSKQFTAAAVALLARDGKLKLDDPVRKYIPELPDYGAPLTIRHMLHHTSGLRDWGNVVEMEGWPRETRIHTHAHVLEVVQRQSRLNFTPGSDWSYSNTGYNLAAILVERVSGMSFARFTQERIFVPLGMTRTSWRDDHSRIVKHRATAYSKQADGYHSLMPFENVVGNGGLLTTVADLLKWNENFERPVVGDANFAAQAQIGGKFNDGRSHNYAMGLFLFERRGLRSVAHGGATAGYRAFLARYPKQQLSVALLCNAANANVNQIAEQIAALYLPKPDQASAPAQASYAASEQELNAAAGLYRNTANGNPMKLLREKEGLRIEGGPTLLPGAAQRFTGPNGEIFEVLSAQRLRVTQPLGVIQSYERVAPWRASGAALDEFKGGYYSADAKANVEVLRDGEQLLFKRHGMSEPLKPVYRDAFSYDGGMLIFRRKADGKLEALSLVESRAWDVRFVRQSPDTAKP